MSLVPREVGNNKRNNFGNLMTTEFDNQTEVKDSNGAEQQQVDQSMPNWNERGIASQLTHLNSTKSQKELSAADSNKCHEELPAVNLIPRQSKLAQYPLWGSLCLVLVVTIVQYLYVPRHFNMNMLWFIGQGWLFYYLMFKSPIILNVLFKKHAKKALKSLNTTGLFLSLSSQGLEWHATNKPLGQSIVPWSSVHFIGTTKRSSVFWKKGFDTILLINCDEMPDYALNLSRLSREQIELLFLWISRKVPATRLSPEALYLQMQSLYGDYSASMESFTQIWSDEFDRRFELANHVCLSPGQLCGNDRYRIEMVVATKINASVYLVSDNAGKRFVLKELIVPVGTEDSIHTKMLEQFSREASLLCNISHESIVKVVDHFVENGRSYVVLDCVQGGNLRQYVLHHGKLSEKLVIDIAKQIADVLCYLSSLEPPIIHRDLTPDNIVYSETDGRIVVVDFGAANIYHTEGTGTLIGKQGYMPPEQFKGKATPASDVYAFGSTLLYLLTAADPPGMGRLPSALDFAGPELLALIKECLELDAENRPSCSELHDRLSRIEKSEKEV